MDREPSLQGFVPLWECTESIVGCRPTQDRLEFLEVDVEDPGAATAIAQSEQGLLFWLFSYLIEDQQWDDVEATKRELKAAAQSVGFRYFDEVNAFQREFGSRTDYDSLLRARSLELAG
jgi:hypothetical protein